MVLVISSVLYLIQGGIGIVVTTTGGSTVLLTAHLLVGLLIFAGVVTALAWTLELRTGDPEDMLASTSTTPLDHDLSWTTERPVPSPTNSIVHMKTTVVAYIRLMKPRLMWLLCLVAVAAMALAGTTGPSLSWDIVLATLGEGILSIGASGTSTTS